MHLHNIDVATVSEQMYIRDDINTCNILTLAPISRYINTHSDIGSSASMMSDSIHKQRYSSIIQDNTYLIKHALVMKFHLVIFTFIEIRTII